MWKPVSRIMYSERYSSSSCASFITLAAGRGKCDIRAGLVKAR